MRYVAPSGGFVTASFVAAATVTFFGAAHAAYSTGSSATDGLCHEQNLAGASTGSHSDCVVGQYGDGRAPEVPQMGRSSTASGATIGSSSPSGSAPRRFFIAA